MRRQRTANDDKAGSNHWRCSFVVTAIYMLTVGAVPMFLRTVVAVMLQQLLGINVSDIPPGGANYCLAAPLAAGRSVYVWGQRFVV